MIRNKLLLILFCFSLSVNASTVSEEETLHDLNKLLINTVMDDLFSPPVASRIYMYPNISFYECIRYRNREYKSFAGKLTDLPTLPEPKDANIDYFIAASISFSYVAQSLVGSEYKFEDWRKSFLESCANTNDADKMNKSTEFGHAVADSIISWSKKDNYLVSKGMPRYTLLNKPGTWQPTPNDYASALEPYWYILRPMTMTSCSQFSPAKKLVYSDSKKSEFYKNVKEVYDIGVGLDSLKKSIAWYWDDNPNISVQEGHLTYFVHKISPGGHWMMIAGQACKERKISIVKTSLAYALTAIGVFDGIIACWDEKFKSNLIRPVTVINNEIDNKWQPLIQTPPFPEFTSGHAVLSNSAATVLTLLLGENFAFTDSTEIPFGIAPRSFKSFYEAAEESAWSRVYGGIHYPETARISIDQGRQIGKNVIYKCQAMYNK